MKLVAYDLTERQCQVLNYIMEHLVEHQFTPTQRNIAEHFGWAGPNAAMAHVRPLIRKGYLTTVKTGKCSRLKLAKFRIRLVHNDEVKA